MKRRSLLAWMAAATLSPGAARAQEPGRTYRIGWLTSTPLSDPTTVMVLDELKNNGFVLGKNLAVDQHSLNNHQLFARDGFIGWLADVPGSPDKYLALFNTNDTAKPGGASFEKDGASVGISPGEVGLPGGYYARNLWLHDTVGNSSERGFTVGIPCHDAALFRLGPLRN